MPDGTIETVKLDEGAIEITIPYEDDDGDHKTHIVMPPQNEHVIPAEMDPSAQEIVDFARMTGQEVIALCGYKWVPKRNPEKYPICQPCLDLLPN